MYDRQGLGGNGVFHREAFSDEFVVYDPPEHNRESEKRSLEVILQDEIDMEGKDRFEVYTHKHLPWSPELELSPYHHQLMDGPERG